MIGALFRLAGRRNGKPETWYCRRLILASGPLSTGGTSIPEAIVAGLPRASEHAPQQHGITRHPHARRGPDLDLQFPRGREQLSVLGHLRD